VWLLQGYLDFQIWWMLTLFSIYGIIIHPAIIHYKLFEEKNKEIIESTLCTTCQHFDKSAVLCMKHDRHPTKDVLPCEGVDWSPKEFYTNKDELKSE
jgi:hypothetical protein